MCLGLSGRVVEVVNAERGVVAVEMGGRRREVSTALLAGGCPAVGEHLLIHAGLAVERVGDEEAAAIAELLEGWGDALPLEV